MALRNRAAMLALYGQEDADDVMTRSLRSGDNRYGAGQPQHLGNKTMTQTQTSTQNTTHETAPLTDREIFATLTTLLLEMPDLIRDADTLATGLGQEAREAKRDVEDAETNAAINCAADGKNAEARKLQVEKAMRDDPAAIKARRHMADIEASLALAEMDLRSQLKRWQGALALAELHAAKINYLSRINSQPTRTK